MNPNDESRLRALQSDLPGQFMTDDDRLETASRDWSGAPPSTPLAVARPDGVEDLAKILAACDRLGQGVVPQGGMTGLAAGAIPRRQDIAIATDQLVGIESIDNKAGTITLRAGTVLSQAQAAAEAEGWLLPIDLGARDSCLLGGCIANNAGGQRVIRHGTTRANLLGVEAVLPSGEVVGDLRGQIKDNTGYHLPSLFAGAEGTLGVITRAVIRLHPLPGGRLTALCALADYPAVLKLLDAARRNLPLLSAFEVMWAAHYAYNAQHLGLNPLAEPPAFAVIIETETDGSPAETDAFESFLEQVFETGIITDAALPQSERELRSIWDIREGISMDSDMPNLVNLDISARPSELGLLADRAQADLEAALPGIRVFTFGHLGDGNLHICAAPADGTEAGADFLDRVDAIVYPLVAGAGGSISAEHGIGTLKRDWLHLMRSPAELALMRRIKAAFDPNGIMNPGKLLP